MSLSVPRMGVRPSDQFIDSFEESLIERYRPRNQDFEVLVNAWHGIYYENADTRHDMDSIGRPMLRVSDARTQNVPETLNIIKSFADAYKRMLVGLPDPRVPRPPGRYPPSLEGQKMAEDYQARMKRACWGIWDASQMNIQQVSAAFWLAICGSVGMVVMPDFTRGHAVIKYVAPWDIYGVGKMGDDYALSRCIVAVDEDYYRVQSEFGDDIAGSPLTNKEFLTAASTAERSVKAARTVRHTIYMDEEWFIRRVGGKTVGEARHNLGFCPALVCPLILLPQYVNRGHSAIEQLLPMQLSINMAVTLWEEGLKDSIFPTTWVRNAQSVPANFARGRGQLITIGEGGDIGELGGQSAQAMRTVIQHVDLMQRLMELNSGVSRPAVSGNLAGGGPTSGRGIEKAQSAYLAGIEEAQTTQGYFMGRALKYALDMTAATGSQHEIWDTDKEDRVTFSWDQAFKDKTAPKTDHFLGQEESFAREDLRGVPMPQMSYSPLAHLGMGERLTMVLQALGSKPPLISWNAAVDMIGWERDHPNLRSEIESDLAWRLEIMAREVAIQMGGQPTPDQQPGADVLRTAAAAAAGATSQTGMRQGNVGGAGNQPAAPMSPTEPIPAGGAPTGMTGISSPISTPVGTSPVVPDLSSLAGGPPEVPEAPAGMPRTQNMAAMLTDELAGVEVNSPVVLFGDTLYVDYRDKNRVRRVVGHHTDLKVVVKGKKGQNVPASATVVASPQKEEKRA